MPSAQPTLAPSETPSDIPSVEPTTSPSQSPTINPTFSPTLLPTHSPTDDPKHSCGDLMSSTYNILTNGVYNISVVSLNRWRDFPVYCVFDYNNSSPNSSIAWTLFESFSLKFSNTSHLNSPWWINRTFNQETPNESKDDFYRISSSAMVEIKNHSQYMLSTCNFSTSLVKDYLIFSISDLTKELELFDPADNSGYFNDTCIKASSVNIGGVSCNNQSVNAISSSTEQHFHISSSSSCGCDFSSVSATIEDDFFGSYVNYFTDFSCSADSTSTTQWWFGSSVVVPPPTMEPTNSPTSTPIKTPTLSPTQVPTDIPTITPSSTPSEMPTHAPSQNPSINPTMYPSYIPTQAPSFTPSRTPSQTPTIPPTTSPSNTPTAFPSQIPSQIPSRSPSNAPFDTPTNIPSGVPTSSPSTTPSSIPSTAPSSIPSGVPSQSPSQTPTTISTYTPSQAPSGIPSQSPSQVPSLVPTIFPTIYPLQAPTRFPTIYPSSFPTDAPTVVPTTFPTFSPTNAPSFSPTRAPTDDPLHTCAQIMSNTYSILKSGIYNISVVSLNQWRNFPVYCVFDYNNTLYSNASVAWTLFESGNLSSFQNENILQIPWSQDRSFNEDTPNMSKDSLYRMSRDAMIEIKNYSQFLFSTCNFDLSFSKDFVWLDVDDLENTIGYDIFSTNNTNDGYFGSICLEAQKINVRNETCQYQSVNVISNETFKHFNILSSSDNCECNLSSGAILNENNFGDYSNINTQFSCSNSNQSTTQWWFGSFVDVPPPTTEPTNAPTMIPTKVPTSSPSQPPTQFPTVSPSFSPTQYPTNMPTAFPTMSPSRMPSAVPSKYPSQFPSITPTNIPTQPPTKYPSQFPSTFPSSAPSLAPTNFPSDTPTVVPTDYPSAVPSRVPSAVPTSIPTDIPTLSPSRTPSVSPTNTPTDVPTKFPTSVPSISPTMTPSNSPSQPPTAVPSINPTMVPSRVPTEFPSRTPSDSPTIMPSNSPSQPPTVAPSNTPSMFPTGSPSQPPTAVPTTSPTQAPTANPTPPTESPTAEPIHEPLVIEETTEDDEEIEINYQMIQSNDISVDVRYITSYDDDIFNPGYKITLESNIEIELDSQGKRNLFQAWLANDGVIFNISLDWDVTDSSGNSVNNSLISSSAGLTQYDEFTGRLIESSDGSNTSYYHIDSYYVIYSDKSSYSKYSGLSLCDALDQSVFTMGKTYYFENTIDIDWEYDGKVYEETNNDEISLKANRKPQNGDCSVTPSVGLPLTDVFNFTCSDWVDNDEIEYNFVKQDTNTFLNTFYSDTIKFAEARFGIGMFNVSAIIVDEYNLAECVSMTVQVTNNITQFSQSSTNFTDWLSGTYEDILTDIGYDFSNTNNNNNNNTNNSTTNSSSVNYELSTVMNVLETTYDILATYADENLNDNDNSSSTDANSTNANTDTTDDDSDEGTTIILDEVESLIELQQEIINVSVDVSQTVVDSEAEAVTLIATLSLITQPLITSEDTVVTTVSTNTNNNTSSNETDSTSLTTVTAVYDSQTIENVLTVVSETVIGTLVDAYDVSQDDDDNSNSTDSSDDDDDSNSIALDSDTAQEVFSILSNLQEMRLISDETSEQALESGSRMVTSTISITNLVLISGVPGEYHDFTSDNLNVKAAKISASEYSECNGDTYGNADVSLSQQLVDLRSQNGLDYMDCTLMLTYDNIYDSAIESTNEFQGKFVLIDVTGEANDYSIGRRRRLRRRRNMRRRRRMQPTEKTNNTWLDKCEPIIFTIYFTGAGYGDVTNGTISNYPECAFYDELSETFSNDGCFVLNSTNSSVTCACRHLTFFGIRQKDLKPSVNFVTIEDFADISLPSLVKYPLGWILVLSWIIVCIVLIFLFDKTTCCKKARVDDIPLIGTCFCWLSFFVIFELFAFYIYCFYHLRDGFAPLVLFD